MLERLKFYNTFMGWALFPVSHKNKKPITPHGFLDASLNWEQILKWYYKHPNCAWGTPTSAERGVIDVDPRNGGLESLAAQWEMMDTPTVNTGGGGFHYYFEFPKGTPSGVVAKGIDRKAEGGYVIVPPSCIDIPEHKGRAYAWAKKLRLCDVGVAKAPLWCLPSTPTKPKASTPTEADTPFTVKPTSPNLLSHPGSPEGERRLTLCQLVGMHLARRDSEASITAMAEEWAAKCSPPFEEWRKHVEKLWVKDGGKVEALPEAKNETPLDVASPSSSFPTLPPEAYHGLLGEMLRAISPETEADPAGVLLGWLACFGNVVGRGAKVKVGPVFHHPALFVGVGGNSSSGAKGDGWAAALCPFREVEPAWAKGCVVNGIGSGEGLIELVADAQTILNKDGTAQVIPGAVNKRRLLRLSEFARCFKLQRREGATLGDNLKEAWDGESMTIPNRECTSTSDYAISLVGDITPGHLDKLMGSGTEGFDGWANRFLWAKVRRQRILDEGGDIGVLTPFLERLRKALDFAKTAGVMVKDDEAKVLWHEACPELLASADTIPHTERARPQVLRLAMIYALADSSAVIRVEHLQAALGVWSYCRASAKLLFPIQPQEPEPLWQHFLNAIMKSPGISRTGLREVAGHKVPAAVIEEALAYLERSGMAYRRMVKANGKGSAAECWYPGVKPDGNGDGVDGESSQLYNLSSLSQNSENKQTEPAVSEGGRKEVPSRPLLFLHPPSLPAPKTKTT
jgi:Bifunctional DNA primase/polymerase, N-terminal/Protein of unknown function (DUF3987)